MSAEAAVEHIRSGDVIVAPILPGGPESLLRAMCARLGELKNITLMCADLSGGHSYLDAIPAGAAGELKLVLLAGQAPKRKDISVDWAPLSLYEIAMAFESGRWRVDVCLAAVTPPDDEGLYRMGPSLSWMVEPARHARAILVEVSERLPFIKGDNGLAPEAIAAWVQSDVAAPISESRVLNDHDAAIGRHVAHLIPNGACMQIGIGSLVESVFKGLREHSRLGLHTGAIGDGAMPLIESGVITPEVNPVMPGRFATLSVRGSQRLYDYVDGDARFALVSTGFFAAPATLMKIPQFVAINSAYAVDLYGQATAESASGVFRTCGGGQLDYMRAARMTPNGLTIIMLPSTGGRDQRSRIVTQLAAGELVTTHRDDVDFVVTEHGVAALRGTTLRER